MEYKSFVSLQVDPMMEFHKEGQKDHRMKLLLGGPMGFVTSPCSSWSSWLSHVLPGTPLYG